MTSQDNSHPTNPMVSVDSYTPAEIARLVAEKGVTRQMVLGLPPLPSAFWQARLSPLARLFPPLLAASPPWALAPPNCS